MPFVPAPNIVEVELRATLAGQGIENRWMVDMLAPPTLVTMETVKDIFDVWASAHYADCLPVTVLFNEWVLSDLSSADGLQMTVPVEPVGGTITGITYPNEVSFCVSLRSGNRGRSARGRTYILAVSRSVMDTDNAITSAFATSLTTAFDALIAALEANGTPLVIVSYRTANAPRVGGPVYFTVQNSTIVDLVVDSQKRRKPGVGS